MHTRWARGLLLSGVFVSCWLGIVHGSSGCSGRLARSVCLPVRAHHCHGRGPVHQVAKAGMPSH